MGSYNKNNNKLTFDLKVSRSELLSYTLYQRSISKMGKEKKEKKDKSFNESQIADENGEEMSYEDRLEFVSVIAKPMATKKLAKKLYKCIKKGMKHKTHVRNGLKDVQSRIRKGEKGLVVFAGDVTPIDVMCHLPSVCEEKGLPYVFPPARALLGQAMGVKRGSLMVMIRKHEEYEELYQECKTEVEQLPTATV